MSYNIIYFYLFLVFVLFISQIGVFKFTIDPEKCFFVRKSLVYKLVAAVVCTPEIMDCTEF